GLSLSFVAIRCFFTSAAAGVNGRPPGMLVPRSKKVARGGAFGSAANGVVGGSTTTPPLRLVCPRGATTPASSCGKPPRSARVQTPDRSGLPSAVRGTLASITTRPSASRGTPDCLNFGHCAKSELENKISAATEAVRNFIADLDWMPQKASCLWPRELQCGH